MREKALEAEEKAEQEAEPEADIRRSEQIENERKEAWEDGVRNKSEKVEDLQAKQQADKAQANRRKEKKTKVGERCRRAKRKLENSATIESIGAKLVDHPHSPSSLDQDKE